MHRNPRTDDIHDVLLDLVRVVDVLDPPPSHLVDAVRHTLDVERHVWSFYAGVSTHELLRAGVTVSHYTKVTVSAATFAEAQDIAACMAACGGWMPTELVRIEDE
jgi:hypothetical protein